MKYLFAILLLPLISQAVLGQERDIELVVSVIDQQSCSAGPNTDNLQLALGLRYTNVGKRKLILYRGNRIFYQAFVNRIDGDATRRLEFRTSHASFYDQEPEKLDASVPGHVFTSLSPGASYATRQKIIVPIAKEGGGRFNVSIGPGKHLLNLAVSTWYESRKLGEALRERWRGRGFLVTEPLISNAVGFSTGDQPALTSCR